MVLGLVSAKGSPGVTSTALALAAAAGERGLLVELDPSGGSVECWTGGVGEPGLIRAASVLRRSADPSAVADCVVEAPRRMRSVLAPTAGDLAESTIGSLRGRLLPALAGGGGTVVVDGGRWSPSQATADRLTGCDAVGVVCRPTVAGVEAARWLVEPLRSLTTATVVVVVIGDRPYTTGEIAGVVGTGVVGPLAWEPRALNALVTAGPGRGWSRSGLARSARRILEAVATEAAPVEVSRG